MIFNNLKLLNVLHSYLASTCFTLVIFLLDFFFFLVTVHNSYFHTTDQFDLYKLSLSLAMVKNPLLFLKILFSLFLVFTLLLSYSPRVFPISCLLIFFVIFKTFLLSFPRTLLCNSTL